MPIMQLPKPCWTIREDQTGQHFDDLRDVYRWIVAELRAHEEWNAAERAQAIRDGRPCRFTEWEPMTPVPSPQPCWIAVCDGRDCGEEFTDDDEGWGIHGQYPEVASWLSGDGNPASRAAAAAEGGWRIDARGRVLCPKEPDETGAVYAPLSHEEQAAAGQGVLPL